MVLLATVAKRLVVVSAHFAAAVMTASVAMFPVSLFVVLLLVAVLVSVANHVVMAVCLKPVELVLLVLYQQIRVTFFDCKLGQYFDDIDQTVCIERSVVLLREPEWPLFPI